MQTFGIYQDRRPTWHTTAISEIVLAGTKGQRLVSRDSNGTVLGWDKPWDSKLPSRPARRISAVSKMMVTPDHRYLLAGHSYGQVCLWKMEDWEDQNHFDSPPQFPDFSVTSLCVAGPEMPSYAVTGYRNGLVQLFDWSQEGRLNPINEAWQAEAGRPILTVLFSPNGHEVLTNAGDNKVLFWNIAKQWKKGQAPLRRPAIDILDNAAVSRIVVDRNRKLFAAATEKGKVLIYRMAPAAVPVHQISIRKAKTKKVSLMTFGPTLKIRNRRAMLIFVAWNIPPARSGAKATPLNRIYRFAASAKGPKEKIGALDLGPEQQITAVGFSEDGKRIVAALDDGSIRIWRVKKLKDPPLVLKGFSSSPVTALLVAGPKGDWIFTGQADGAVRRWNVDKWLSANSTRAQLKKVGNNPGKCLAIVNGYLK
jgi:WD40 repeat protein